MIWALKCKTTSFWCPRCSHILTWSTWTRRSWNIDLLLRKWEHECSISLSFSAYFRWHPPLSSTTILLLTILTSSDITLDNIVRNLGFLFFWQWGSTHETLGVPNCTKYLHNAALMPGLASQHAKQAPVTLFCKQGHHCCFVGYHIVISLKTYTGVYPPEWELVQPDTGWTLDVRHRDRLCYWPQGDDCTTNSDVKSDWRRSHLSSVRLHLTQQLLKKRWRFRDNTKWRKTQISRSNPRQSVGVNMSQHVLWMVLAISRLCQTYSVCNCGC